MKLLLQSEINITSIHCQNLQFKPKNSNDWYYLGMTYSKEHISILPQKFKYVSE